MRVISPFKLIILSILLLITAYLINSHSSKRVDIFDKKPLKYCFAKVGSGLFANDFYINASIVEALKLDDYLFKSYERDKGQVNLYIGYYRTAKKIGEVHDPLVCFSGQGWQLKNRESGDYTLTRYPNLKVSYSSMIAERQGESEFVVYWFQSNGKAMANTQSQKIAMILDKFSGKSEDNAFVRISAPVKDETPETVRKRIFDFIEDFYPDFYRYVNNSK